jgi:hypothetical protein
MTAKQCTLTKVASGPARRRPKTPRFAPLVLHAGAGNDWHKDRQFQKLNAQKEAIDVKVVRGGRDLLVQNTEVGVWHAAVLAAPTTTCFDLAAGSPWIVPPGNSCGVPRKEGRVGQAPKQASGEHTILLRV